MIKVIGKNSHWKVIEICLSQFWLFGFGGKNKIFIAVAVIIPILAKLIIQPVNRGRL